MPRLTVIFALLLIAVGLIGAYLAVQDGAKPVTALIPAYFGAALLILGGLGFQPKLRMHVMHVAVLIGLIGFGVPGFMVVKALVLGTIARPVAFGMQAVMAVVCLLYVILCVKSFIDARRARKAAANG